MDTLEKVELTTSICHIARILKSGIPIFNSEVPYMAGRKMRRMRRRSQAFPKCYAFHANAVNSMLHSLHIFSGTFAFIEFFRIMKDLV